MDHHRENTMQEVTSAFAAWKKVNDRIGLLQQTLEHPSASGSAPLPELQSERQALEREAERLLMHAQQALLKIKTPRSSSGDSVWG